MEPVVATLPLRIQCIIHPEESRPWPPEVCRRKKPGHQQTWYWPPSPAYSSFGVSRVRDHHNYVIQISRKCVPKDQIINTSASVQLMASSQRQLWSVPMVCLLYWRKYVLLDFDELSQYRSLKNVIVDIVTIWTLLSISVYICHSYESNVALYT